jgi:hypothetical protein
MLKGKLRMKVMQEVHDAPMVGHCGEKTTRELLGEDFLLALNEGRHTTLHLHMRKVPKY